MSSRPLVTVQASIPPTKLQVEIIRTFAKDKGYGEGIIRLYQRLKALYKDKVHPGLDANGNCPRRRAVANELREPEKPDLSVPSSVTLERRYATADDRELKYRKNGTEYTIPTRKVYEPVIGRDGVTPIAFDAARHTRFFASQPFYLKPPRYAPRRLCPTRKSIEDFYRADPRIQVDRATRNNVAGGKRTPLKSAIGPNPPKRFFHYVYVDTLRMPVVSHRYEDRDISREKLLEAHEKPKLLGGARTQTSTTRTSTTRTQTSTTRSPTQTQTRSRGPPTGSVAFKWLLVCVDGFTKVIWLKEIKQQDNLDINMTNNRTNLLQNDDDDDEDDSEHGSEDESEDEDDDYELQSNVSSEHNESDDYDDYDVDDDETSDEEGDDASSERPQSEQTFKAFELFVKRMNEVRARHAANRPADPNNPAPPYKFVHPKYVVHDKGSEFMGAFKSGLQRLRRETNSSNADNEEGLEGETRELQSNVVASPRRGATTFRRNSGGTPSEHGEESDGNKLEFYIEKMTPSGRSQYNSIAERAVRTVRRYFYSLRNAFEESYASSNKPPPHWHSRKQLLRRAANDPYDWVLDVEEVLKRYNSAYHTTIRTTPLRALLATPAENAKVVANLTNDLKRRYKDVQHELPLPGFTSNTPPVVGDFVRKRTYKKGNMSANFPMLDGTNNRSKSSSQNWSLGVYVITAVKVYVPSRQFREAGPYKGARLYKVKPIDPRDTHNPGDSWGRNTGYLDRTQILKIPPETIIGTDDDGAPLTVKRSFDLFEANDHPDQRRARDEANRQQRSRAGREAARAARADKRAADAAISAARDDERQRLANKIPLKNRSRLENLGDFTRDIPAFVYRRGMVLEFNRRFVLQVLEEDLGVLGNTPNDDWTAFKEFTELLDERNKLTGVRGTERRGISGWALYGWVLHSYSDEDEVNRYLFAFSSWT